MSSPTVPPPSRSSTPGVVRLTLIVEGALLALALLVGGVTGHSPVAALALREAGVDLAWGVLATLPLLPGIWWTLRSRLPAMGALRDVVREHVLPLFAGCSRLHLAVIALAAGVAEEAFFRGFLQQLVASWTSPGVGLVLVSLLFGAVHLVNATYGLLATLIGLYLGSLYLVSGSLVVPVVVHAIYDYVALVILLRTLGSTRPPAQGEEEDPAQATAG